MQHRARREAGHIRSGLVAVGLACWLAVGAACTAPTPPAVDEPSPSPLRPACAADDQGSYWAPPDAGEDQGAVLTMGAGDRGVLLVPQSGGDICQWVSDARQLVLRGYRVAMMNWGSARGDSVAAAYEELRASGARTIVLVGASMGASYALHLAPTLKPAAVVTFSADPGPSGVEVDSELAHYDRPVLFVGSQDDFYAPAALTRHLAREHPGPERVIGVDGDAHGLAILAENDKVRAAFYAFLSKELGGG